MTAEQFTYWLQGFSELNDGETPTPAQWSSIQDHLKLVFTKVTPPIQQVPRQRTVTSTATPFDPFQAQTYC